MIIDHNYASKFEFKYSLILDKEQHEATVNTNKGNKEEFDIGQFVNAEDTKTLYFIYYAYQDAKLRCDDTWLIKEVILDKYEIVANPNAITSSAAASG